MCGVKLRDRERAGGMMLGLIKAMDQLAVTNSVRWYGHRSQRENTHVSISILDFEVDS